MRWRGGVRPSSAGEVFRFDGYPVPGNAGIDCLDERQVAIGSIAAEQRRGVPGELAALRLPVLDDGFETGVVQFGQFRFEFGKVTHSRLGRGVLFVFFLSRYLLW
jgi:hypothetical protein